MSGGGDKQYLNEVIRLHSPIWTNMRRPKDEVCVENYVLPKDCVIITSPWLMARNPNYFRSRVASDRNTGTRPIGDLRRQRVHIDDLTGFLLAQSDEWDVLSLPG